MLSLAEFQLLASFQCLFIVLKKEKKKKKDRRRGKNCFPEQKGSKKNNMTLDT